MCAPETGAAVLMGACARQSAAARLVALPIVFLLAQWGYAEEIAPYRLTGIDGYVTLNYVQDEQVTDPSGGMARSRQAQSGIRNEIFVMTHSYVYHPNLLTLDIGGGPVLHGESYVGDNGETTARGVLYNFSARATVLRDKPYTGALFFSHLNPAVSVAPGQVLTQENTRYGFDFSLLAPVTTIPLQVGFTRSHTVGRSTDRQVDDSVDQFNFSANRSYGALGATQMQYQSSRQASQSGSQNLPIQSSSAQNQSVNFDTRLQFGADRQYSFANVVSFNMQKYALEAGTFPELNDQRLLFDLRARHSDKLHSYGFYNYGHSSQGELDSVTQAASAGLSYWPMAGLESSFGLRGDSNRTRQFATQSHGLDGNIRYEQPLPLGVAQISYGVRYDSRSQQSQSSQTGVLGERVTLAGIAAVSLAHPYVISGTAVVTNVSRTQTFVEGIDYALTVVGVESRLQRLVGGRILDGEQVLVDYAYSTGGTYASSQIDQTLNLNWNVSRYLNAYFRRFVSTPSLISGAPTFPLNEVKSSTYGLRADLPLNAGLPVTVGGSIEFEDRNETISPYRRLVGDLYLQTDEPLFGLGNVRAAMRRSRIAYAVATQDSDLRSYELRFWSRRWFGINLTAALSAERDDAGFIPRRRTDGIIGAQWQERKFSLTSSLVRTRENQAGVGRDRTTFQFLAKRDF
ncbi:MAG: hypothetical protein Q7S85_10285 [Rugosibacter sp.]|nr:hypothetical protein [Rugosibacter sp.]